MINFPQSVALSVKVVPETQSALLGCEHDLLVGAKEDCGSASFGVLEPAHERGDHVST